MLSFLKQLSKKQRIIFGSIGTVVLLALIVAVIPPLRERALYRLDELNTRIFFTFSQPEKTVFVPEKQVQTAVMQTLVVLTPEVTATQPLPAVTPTAGPTATATIVPTALPAMVQLTNVPYIDQHGLWNYCAPSNLAMQLSFWGWKGKRTDIGAVVKPVDLDKNVMPYELADYVNSNTDYKAIVRYGGTVDVLKKIVAAGFPVLVEKGVYFPEAATGQVSWMGHYNIVLGYDDASQQFITHDSFLPDGKFKHFGYDELKQQWRAFDYIFLIVYPSDHWDTLAQALGSYADENQSYTLAQDIATNEMGSTTGVDHFFAIFNRGTNLVKQQDFLGAAGVYDEAYNFYATLPEKIRPYRMTWYQTGPYFSYYYAGRYHDVVTLADTTLGSTPDPYLEESYYWRSMAEVKLGQRDTAVKDLCASLKAHPAFPPSVSLMQDLGGPACP